MAEEKDTKEEKIRQMSLNEQSIQQLVMQKQQFQSQLIEVESALKEIDSSKESFKIIGNIMVSSKKEDLLKELKEKKEMAELRIKNLEKQESSLKEKQDQLREEVLGSMKEE